MVVPSNYTEKRRSQWTNNETFVRVFNKYLETGDDVPYRKLHVKLGARFAKFKTSEGFKSPNNVTYNTYPISAIDAKHVNRPRPPLSRVITLCTFVTVPMVEPVARTRRALKDGVAVSPKTDTRKRLQHRDEFTIVVRYEVDGELTECPPPTTSSEHRTGTYVTPPGHCLPTISPNRIRT